jgi:hypothetical protein
MHPHPTRASRQLPRSRAWPPFGFVEAQLLHRALPMCQSVLARTAARSTGGPRRGRLGSLASRPLARRWEWAWAWGHGAHAHAHGHGHAHAHGHVWPAHGAQCSCPPIFPRHLHMLGHFHTGLLTEVASGQCNQSLLARLCCVRSAGGVFLWFCKTEPGPGIGVGFEQPRASSTSLVGSLILGF